MCTAQADLPSEFECAGRCVLTISGASDGVSEGKFGARAARWWHGLNERLREPEIMDQPNLDARRHQRALRGLARLNWISNSSGILWPSVVELSSRLGRTISILDLATGGGDVPIGLWQRARRASVNVELCGLDISSRAVEVAAARAARQGAKIRFDQHDVLQADLPSGFDMIVCSLFMHHLSREEAIELLINMSAAAGHRVLVNDLVRGRQEFVLASAAARLLTLSSVVWFDAPRSVRAAFTLQEMRELAAEAGMNGATVAPRWPCRMLLEWRRA